MTIEQDMQTAIVELESNLNGLISESKKMLNNISNLKHELAIKRKAKAMFLGERLPKKVKKKKAEEVKAK